MTRKFGLSSFFLLLFLPIVLFGIPAFLSHNGKTITTFLGLELFGLGYCFSYCKVLKFGAKYFQSTPLLNPFEKKIKIDLKTITKIVIQLNSMGIAGFIEVETVDKKHIIYMFLSFFEARKFARYVEKLNIPINDVY